MKTFLFSTCLLFVVAFTNQAQDCNLFIPNKEGAIIEQTYYDAKDKETSKQILTVKKVTNSADGIRFDVNAVTEQKKADPVEVDYTMWCKGDRFVVDMKQFVSKEYVSSYQDASVDATDMDYPKSLSVGQTLSDGKITVSLSQEGVPMPMTTTVNIVNRKVEAKESITTPAGTFECYKITYDINIKMMMKIQVKAAEWISLGVGTVKSETYSKKGKLSGYSLLTALK